jgi:putative flavoprotein involved in K+ transport
MGDQQLGTVVIGGSQAGLAVGYHLMQRGLAFAILDENDRIGDAWRRRWDSLRLFTPGRYDGLPGMPFPGSPSSYPTKDQTADYLEAYARKFELPVRTGVNVDRLSKVGDRFEVIGSEYRLFAKVVVVATGAYNHPRVPPFARELEKTIVQLYSKEYRNRSQIQDGGVLVVGAGNSGAEIAIELAPHHRTWLSGRDTGQEPTRAGSLPDHLFTPIMWFMATRLTVKTRFGRKLRDHFLDPPRGIPLGRVRRKDFAAAGIERVPRMTGVRNGYPVLEDGRVLKVSNVVWCTGFTTDYGWIDLSLPTHNGVPVHDRGIVESCPGLYFIGLPFLYSLSSALLGGVGRDAEHIVAHIVSTRLSRRNDTVAGHAHLASRRAGRRYRRPTQRTRPVYHSVAIASELRDSCSLAPLDRARHCD